MNRNLIISFILGLILIFAIGGYFVFYKSGPVAPAPEETLGQPATLPGGTPKTTTVNGFNITPTSTPANDQNNDQLKSIRGFYQLTAKAIGGGTNDIYSGTTSHSVLFIEKATGYVFKINPIERQSVRLTNTLIPRIRQAWWGQNKNKPVVLINYTDKDGFDHWFNALIKTASSGEVELAGADFDQNIIDLDISPDGKNIAYLKTEGEFVLGNTVNIETGKKTTVFKSVFRDWNIGWNTLSAITLNSKPAAGVPGLALTLNPQTTQTRPLLENINGLTTLASPNGTKILYSTTNSFSGIDLSISDLVKKSRTDLNLNTLPEKCVWSNNNIDIYCGVPNPLPAGSYPDLWYSGEIGFSDVIWKINTDTGEASILVNPQLENLGQAIDVYQPFLSPNEKYLFLTNKNNLTLWALDLAQ